MIARMLCLVLVCFTLDMSGAASHIVPKANPVKQSFNGRAMTQLGLTMKEDMLVEMLPFKPPFKMDKKQMAVIIKLLKKAVKPVLKSERLKNMVIIVDDFMQDLEHNPENKKYYAGILEVAQSVYKGVNRMYTANQNDEGQARTLQTVTNIYRESVLNNWVVRPIYNWVISPFASGVSTAAQGVASGVTTAAQRVYNMIPGPVLVINTDYVDPFASWSETFNNYVSQLSTWSSTGRDILLTAALIMEEQEMNNSI